MDLFDYMRETNKEKESPLASRMRPASLDEVVGQQHIIGKDKLLYRAIKADKLSSVIFYGPPGTGKTTLAKVIANTTSAEFKQINATVAGKKDMEEVSAEEGDHEGLVNIGRNIEGVEVSIFIRQNDEENAYKASLRSGSYVNVSDVCLMFGGGGHPRAAGALIQGDVKLVKEKLLKEIKKYL